MNAAIAFRCVWRGGREEEEEENSYIPQVALSVIVVRSRTLNSKARIAILLSAYGPTTTLPDLVGFCASLPCAARCFHFLDLYPPTTARARNDVWTSFASMMTIPLITITIFFFPGPLRHSFPHNASDISHLSHHSLTCIVSSPASPSCFCNYSPFPPLNLHFSVLLLLLPFWLYDRTDLSLSLSLWFPSSFHLHPFTLSLSYDYFLLPRICILPPLTLTTRASPSSSFKSTHSLPLLSLSLSHPSIHPHTHPRIIQILSHSRYHQQPRTSTLCKY